MGRDKAFIDYHGYPQYEWAADLLESHCEHVYISASERISTLLRRKCIVDQWLEEGPLAALLSAHLSLPDQDIFLLPCDMPYLTGEDLSVLYNRFTDSPELVHCYEYEGHLNPLFAVWPSCILEQIAELFERGERSPKRVMERLGFVAHQAPDASRLRNVNE